MLAKRQLQERRQRIVDEMMAIESMRRGTLNEQFLRVPHKGKKEPVLRGPYFVLSRKLEGRTVSERVAPEHIERVRKEIERYERFMALCREFVELTEALGSCEQDEQTLKKTPKSPSRRTRK